MDHIDLSSMGGILAESSDEDGAADDAPRAAVVAASSALASGQEDPQLPLPQIDMPKEGALVVDSGLAARPAFARQSAELLQYARQVKATKAALAKLQVATEAGNAANDTLALVATTLPGANALLGGAVKRRRLDKASAMPKQFCALALAAHIPLRQDIRVGVKRKRLVCAMARFLLRRQESALAKVLDNARLLSNSVPARGGNLFSAFAYAHQWDESRSFFARFAASEDIKHRAGKVGQHIEVMVQRGSCAFELTDLANEQSHKYSEEWLAPHLAVEGTGASDIWPGLKRCLPQWWQVDANGNGMASIAEAFDVSIFLPLGDRASSNVAIMRHIGCAWESSPLDQKRKVLVLMETCQVHSHHRGKCQLTSLKRHVGRHYSIAQMYRLPDVRSGVIAYAERYIDERFVRDVRTQPPPGAERCKVFVDILFHLGRAHHRRSANRESALLRDLRAFLEVANGDPCPEDGVIRHHCIAAPGATPCCASEEDAREKYTTRLINVLLGPSERLPTESRWTNLLPAMKRTLLRKFLHNINLHVVGNRQGGDAPDAIMMDDEAQAASDYFTKINGVRAKRAAEYLQDEGTLWELAVLTVGLDIVDDLLFAMLGGAERTEAPAKVRELLDRPTSLIAEVQESLLKLLDGGRSGPTGAPRDWLDEDKPLVFRR